MLDNYIYIILVALERVYQILKYKNYTVLEICQITYRKILEFIIQGMLSQYHHCMYDHSTLYS